MYVCIATLPWYSYVCSVSMYVVRVCIVGTPQYACGLSPSRCIPLVPRYVAIKRNFMCHRWWRHVALGVKCRCLRKEPRQTTPFFFSTKHRAFKGDRVVHRVACIIEEMQQKMTFSEVVAGQLTPTEEEEAPPPSDQPLPQRPAPAPAAAPAPALAAAPAPGTAV